MTGVRNTDNRSNADPKVVGTDLFAGAKNSQSQWNSSSQATSGTPSAGGSTRSLYGSSVGPKTDDELDVSSTEYPDEMLLNANIFFSHRNPPRQSSRLLLIRSDVVYIAKTALFIRF